MGKINETLTLTDGFSASFRTFIQMGAQSTNTANTLNNATEQFGDVSAFAAKQLDSMRGALAAQQSLYAAQGQQLQNQINKVSQLTQKYNQLLSEKGAEANATLRAASALARAQVQEQNLELRAYKTAEAIAKQNRNIEQFQAEMSKAVTVTEQAERAQRNHNEAIEKTNRSAGSLLSTLRSMAAAAGVTALTKAFLQTSDEMSQINAKLNMINDGSQSNAQLQEMIYQSAQRTRTSYQTTANIVARLGNNAREAFGNNAELIQFAENLNKQFIIAGSSQEEMASASLQLTQALGAGALRGEELNSVFEAAPNIIRTIADYLGVGVGEIREMAADGQITAEVVKNAMLSATDEINTMPMTLAQAFTMGKNYIQQALMGSFEGWSNFLNTEEGQQALGQLISLFTILAQVGVGALSAVGQGALWVSQNLDFIIPILAAIGAALAFVKAQAMAEAAATVAGNLAKAASWAIANWQIILFAALLASALIAAQQFGIGFEEVAGWVGQVLGMLYAIGYNVFASLWNVIAAFAEFFANVWNDSLGATARLFFSVFDTILGIVETVAGAIDALLGSDLSSAVSGFRSQLSGWVDDTFGENAVQIKRMANLDVAATSQQWGDMGSNIGSKLDNMNISLEDIAGGLGGLGDISVPSAGELDIGDVGSVGRVKNIEGDVNLSDEDLKLYRDLAERRYMNRVELQTLAPQITVSIPESAAKNLTSQDIADKLKAILIQQQAAHTAVSHG